MNKITITNNLKVSTTISSTEPFELLENIIPQETLDILNVSLDDSDLIENIRAMWSDDTSRMSDGEITRWVNGLRRDYTSKSLKVDKAGVLDFKFIQDQHKELTDDELFNIVSKTIPTNTVSIQYPVEELKTKFDNVRDWVNSSDLPSDIKSLYKELINLLIKAFADNGIINILDNEAVKETIDSGDTPTTDALYLLKNMSECENTNQLLWNIMLYKMIRHTEGSLLPIGERKDKIPGLGFLLYLPYYVLSGTGLDKKSLSSYYDFAAFVSTNYEVLLPYTYEILYTYNFTPAFVTYITYQSSDEEVPKLSVLFFSAEVDDYEPTTDGTKIWYTTTDNEIYDFGRIIETLVGAGATYNGPAVVSNEFDEEKQMWCMTFDDDVTLLGDVDTEAMTVEGPFFVTFESYDISCNVETVVLPKTVTRIGNYAFIDCNGLTSIEIPNSVTSIGSYAFSYCTGLNSVTIPDSVTSIGSYAFYDCTSLTSIVIPNSVTSIEDSTFSGCSSLTSIVIPNSVTSIEDSTFSGCSSLTSIVIPNSVTSIGNSAFSYCTGLNSVTIPDSVTSIGSYAFDNCTSLTSIVIPNSVTSIEDSTFSGCSSLTSIEIPNSVTSIGNSAFSGCTNLTSITIPNSVTSIEDSAFSGCSGLTSIEIPNSVTSIGSYAFFYCTGLNSVTIPDSVTSIGSGTFSGCTSLNSVTVGNSVTSIGNSVFSNCTGLNSIIVESGNSVYDSRNNCNAIIETSSNKLIVGCQDTIIPDSVTSIGSYAFDNCTSLTSIVIPNSVTSIGYFAFSNCTGLTSVTIPDSVTSIGSGTFSGCSSLTSIDVASTNPNYSSVDGVLFNKNKTNLIQYTMGNAQTEYTIPDSVTSIESYAFYNCTSLTSVTIPDSVTSIGNSAFYNCTSLPTIDNCRYADTYLTEAVDKTLSTYTIKDGTRFIGTDAFHNCTNLTSITIPNSVTSIEDSAFGGCSGLTSIEIPDSVTSIGSYAFSGCSGLTSIVIPNSVTSIGSYAFYNCTSLTSVTIPDSVTSIGDSAFRECRSLNSVTIGNSVTNIEYQAFFVGDESGESTYPGSLQTITVVDGQTYNYNGETEFTITLANGTDVTLHIWTEYEPEDPEIY